VVAAAHLDLAVHPDDAVADEELRLAASRGGAAQLDERPQREGPPDVDVDQLLSRIGMMR
jgi:hypothetical protein